MRTSITVERYIDASRAAVAAAVDRCIRQTDDDVWRLAAWSASLGSWRRAGRWHVGNRTVGVSIDLLDAGHGRILLAIVSERPGWLGPRTTPAVLQSLATRIAEVARGRGSPAAVPTGATAVGSVAATRAAPVVGYSAP